MSDCWDFKKPCTFVNMLEAFKSYISSTELFDPSERILLAVSGGVDSMALVKLFKDAGYKFAIAHANFKLRQTESDEDELFVKHKSEQLGVPYYIKQFGTKQFASKKKISIQMAARDLRYAWFEEIRNSEGYDWIATAHHLDDQAETFFINLLRGTGISGIHGILPKQGKIIRPMMFTTRDRVLEYAQKNKLEWREDSSNNSTKYLRNKLRHDVLPEFYKINPQFSYKLNESIGHIRQVEEIFNSHIAGITSDMVQPSPEGTLISIDWVYEYKPHDTYLLELLKPFGFTFPVVKEIVKSLDTFSGKVFYSPTHRLLRDRENFIIQPLSELESKDQQNEGFFIPQGMTAMETPFCMTAYQTEDLTSLPIGIESVACLDLDKLVFPLRLRKWEKGDWFIPLGLKGKKKLSDFFVNQKLSLAEKERTWILTSGSDIVWVVGKRIDDRFRISSSTQRAYVLNCLGAESLPLGILKKCVLFG